VCGEAFDIRQEFTDDSLTECPRIIDGKPCGGKLRKLYNTVGVSFNGPGFYRTDSREGSKAGAKSPSSESASGGTTSSESKPAESKPAASSSPAPASTAAPASKD
jgi:predicted nucleic acid-binding Zn ribbon protein